MTQIITPNPDQAQRLLSEPGIIPWHVNGAKAQILCRQLSEEQIYTAAFLDQRLPPMQEEQLYAIPLSAFEGLSNTDATETTWIFHTSFCASTLLARLLQSHKRVLVMKEPMVFNQLADAFRLQPQNQRVHRSLFNQISRLLSRPFRTDQKVILKTSNYMNSLLDQVHQIDNAAKVLLVWGGIREFARSMLKNREEAIKTVPVFLRALKRDAAVENSYEPGTEFWQDIAHLWAVQIHHFSHFVKTTSLPVATVTKKQIIETPEQVTATCDDFMEIRVRRDNSEIAAIMGKDSKRQSSKPSIAITNEKKQGDNDILTAVEELAYSLIPDDALQTLEAKSL